MHFYFLFYLFLYKCDIDVDPWQTSVGREVCS